MDATVRFYHGVLGARLVATIGTPQFRHYFFEFGAQNTVAFFEYTGVPVDRFAKPAGVPDPRAVQFDHLSFNLPDEHALLDLRDRLKSAGCEVTDVVDHGFIRSIYFTDPNGIALEASWWALDATGRPADYGDDRLVLGPEPGPRRERDPRPRPGRVGPPHPPGLIGPETQPAAHRRPGAGAGLAPTGLRCRWSRS